MGFSSGRVIERAQKLQQLTVFWCFLQFFLQNRHGFFLFAFGREGSKGAHQLSSAVI